VVYTVYTIAFIMAWDGTVSDLGFSALNIAGLLVVLVSGFYHYTVISPANGFQNLTLLITQYVGIATGLGLVADRLILR